MGKIKCTEYVLPTILLGNEKDIGTLYRILSNAELNSKKHKESDEDNKEDC